MKRSFKRFSDRLVNAELYLKIQALALKHHVLLSELYDGDKSPSIISARRAVYVWLIRQGKSVNEVARLFDRAPSGVWKMTRSR